MKCKKFPSLEVSKSYKDALGERCDDEKRQEESLLTQFASSTQTHHVDEHSSFEERLDKVISCIGSQNSLREILYKTLAACRIPKKFDELERFISEQDEFVHSHILQTPFTLIEMLVSCCGLHKSALDIDGNVIDEQMMASLSEDELSDITDGYLLEITDAGEKAVELLDPAHRIAAQLAQKPYRRETYFAVLDFCTTPRTFPEIQEFFKETPNLVQDEVVAHQKLSPDFYVDKLECAGALVWKGRWTLTEAGKQMLAARSNAAGELTA